MNKFFKISTKERFVFAALFVLFMLFVSLQSSAQTFAESLAVDTSVNGNPAQNTSVVKDNPEKDTSSSKEKIETIVVTASRVPQDLSAVARTVDVIDATQISLTNHAHVQELFNQMPGVNFHRNSGQEYLAAIRSPVLTGAGACGEFLILENGIPLRPAGMCNVNELFEANHYWAESVEILRGASASQYGSNGLHGVVNLVTPQLPNGSGETDLTLGSYDYYKLRHASQIGDWSLAFSVVDDGGFRDDSGVKHQVGTIKHQGESADYNVTSWLTAFNLDQETAGYLVGEGAYKDKALIKTNANPEAYRKGDGFRLYQTYRWQNGLVISPYLRYSNMAFMQHFLPGQPTEKNRQTSLGVQTSNNWRVNDSVDINYGVDAELAAMSLLQFQDEKTEGSAFLQATIPTGKHYDYKVDSKNIASFVVTNIKMSPELNLNIGARAEYIEFDYRNEMVSGRTDELGQACGFGGCRYSRPENRFDDYFQLSPQLGATYQLANNSQLYGSLIHGFRSPQATELYRLQRAQTVADLDPVELKGFDGGWRFQDENLSLDIAFYQYKKSNGIIRNTDFFNISGAKTKHRGAEISFETVLTETFSLAVNASFADHTYLNNPGINESNAGGSDIVGLDIDTSPNEMANVFLNYQSNAWSWQLHGQYNGEYFTDVENQHRYPGHTLFHFRASYQLNAKVLLGVRLQNLTDERYAERADYSSFSGDRYFPGKPRSINISISYKY
ncbi:TonB-dependent receptor [Psychrosphaera aestuarii]|uniref:TonB-dependent receptor n=1 Tax=Psychrosphaera aestuarii TaxID=1266052 RepID=UPI001B33C960|nr:TonB-dependent receptor [Psychrosphaera aestuarii]